MTISNTTVRQLYQANGSNTDFAIPFDFTNENEIVVYTRDETQSPVAEALKVLGTDYTLVGGPPVTTVRFNSAPSATLKVLIIRINPLTQSTDYIGSGTFPAETHEEALDKLTRIHQELNEKLNRSPKFSVTSPHTQFTIPDPVASRVIGFNTDADDLALFPTTDVTGQFVDADIANNAAISLTKLSTITANRAIISNASGYLTNSSVTNTELGYVSGVTSPIQTQFNDVVQRINHKGWIENIAITNTTTTHSNDTIKITSANGSPLSSSNVGYVWIPSSNGIITRLSATSDVSFVLTGAHWGADLGDDVLNLPLYVYAINDSGTLKWGVNATGFLRKVATASTSASIVDQINEMYVNTTTTVGSPCLQIGEFYADFDDTGGAAENLWQIRDKVRTGLPDGHTSEYAFCKPTGTWTTNTQYAMRFRRNGSRMEGSLRVIVTGAPTASSLIISLPMRMEINGSNYAHTDAIENIYAGQVRVTDVGTVDVPGVLRVASTTTIRPMLHRTSTGTWGQEDAVSHVQPMTWASGDYLYATFSVEIVGWNLWDN